MRKRLVKLYDGSFEDENIIYQGEDRRLYDEDYSNQRRADHDLLKRIDANLENFLEQFKKHEEYDLTRFEKIDHRLVVVERTCYMAAGVIFFIEIIAKFIK